MKRLLYTILFIVFEISVSCQTPTPVDGSMRNDGVFNSEPIVELHGVKWTFELEGTVYGPGVVVDSIFYIGDGAGYLYALQANTGELIWKFKTGKRVVSCPTVIENKAVFGSIDGYLYCVEKDTGKEIWKFKTGGGAACYSPLIIDQQVYFGAHDNLLYIVDLHSGDLIKSKDMGHGMCCSFTQVDNTLYLSDWGGNLYCMQKDSLSVMWEYKANSKAYETSSVDEENVYYANFDSTVTALNQKTGDVVWNRKVEGIPSRIGVVENTVFFYTNTCNLYVLDKSSGEIKWTFKAEGEAWSRAIYSGGLVYFGAGDNKLYALDFKTGEKLWDYEANAPVTRPSIYNSVLYFGADNKIYALY